MPVSHLLRAPAGSSVSEQRGPDSDTQRRHTPLFERRCRGSLGHIRLGSLPDGSWSWARPVVGGGAERLESVPPIAGILGLVLTPHATGWWRGALARLTASS